MIVHRYLRRWEEMGVWDRLHADLVIVDVVTLRAFGGPS